MARAYCTPAAYPAPDGHPVVLIVVIAAQRAQR